MKKIYFIIVLLILVVVVWLSNKRHSAPTEVASEKTNAPPVASHVNQTPSNVPPVASHFSQTTSSPTPAMFNVDKNSPEQVSNMVSEIERRKQAAAERVHNEWKTPIEFYGRVVDESNNSVADANVHFIWNDLSEKGTSEADTKSDGNGLFSLTGKSGKAMTVYVNKAGYYEYAPAGLSFNYAGENQNFIPDAGNPIVFHLRKKGEGTDLIHYDKNFQLPTDGTPVLIDLPTGKITASSQNAIAVQVWIYEKIDRWKFNWKCRISVPGGGLQIYDEVFPFLAPEENYVSEEVIDMPVTNNPSWSNQARRNYYVRTADGKFGRMVFMMIPAGDHFCELNLYFNPTGSRNLEPK